MHIQIYKQTKFHKKNTGIYLVKNLLIFSCIKQRFIHWRVGIGYYLFVTTKSAINFYLHKYWFKLFPVILLMDGLMDSGMCLYPRECLLYTKTWAPLRVIFFLYFYILCHMQHLQNWIPYRPHPAFGAIDYTLLNSIVYCVVMQRCSDDWQYACIAFQSRWH